jgi:hypothetical protein
MDLLLNGVLYRGAMTGREGRAMRHGSGELLEDIRGLLPGHAPTETAEQELKSDIVIARRKDVNLHEGQS